MLLGKHLSLYNSDVVKIYKKELIENLGPYCKTHDRIKICTISKFKVFSFDFQYPYSTMYKCTLVQLFSLLML